jgi:hypothetical protein
MLSIGNDELDKKPVNTSSTATCPKCKKQHEIVYGETILPNGSRKPSKTIGVVNCPDTGGTYMVEFMGRLM